MYVFLHNLSWMLFNIILALTAIAFAQVTLKSKQLIIKVIAGFAWLFFLPNTIYLLTDVINIAGDVHEVSGIFLILDVVMYTSLIPIGIVTFILAVEPVERLFLGKMRGEKVNGAAVFTLNLLVGFGLVLGRIQRVNSWEVVTNIDNVIQKSIGIINSAELLALVLIFALLCQLSYMFFKKRILSMFNIK